MPIKPAGLTKKQEKEWEEKVLEEWKKRYHNLFSTAHGKAVLSDMLEELSFFNTVENEEDRIKSNYAKRLLYLCGGWTCELSKRSK